MSVQSTHYGEAHGSPPLRILIVDNDEDTTYTTSLLLENKGHDVESALSAQSAIGRMAVFQPDLVLLDLLMPDMDGVEAGQAIRNMGLSHQPVLAAYSGATSAKIQRRCAVAGFDHYLVKPVEMQALVALLQNLGAR